MGTYAERVSLSCLEVHSLAKQIHWPTLSTQAFAMAVRTLSAVQKDDNAFVEDAGKNVVDSEEEVAVREFDPKFMRKTTLKVC